MSTDVQKITEEIKSGFEAFKAANDARLAALEEKRSDPLIDEKLKRIDDALTEMCRKQAQIEAAASRAAVLGVPSDERSALERKAFDTFLRNRHLDEGERKALSTSTASDGGYLVPAEMDTQISRVVAVATALRARATTINISSGSYKKLISLGGAGAGWVGERASRGETATPTLSEIEITAQEMYANPAVTKQILDDALVNIEEMLAGELAIAFGELDGDAFINGSGVTRPRGIIGGYTPVANASYAWGAPGYIATGATGFASSNPADDLFDVQHALKPQYHPNARWIMADGTLSTVRQFKESTTGNYLWVPGLAGAPNGVLLGSPVDLDNYMPAVANLAFPIAYGDFARAYTIVERAGTSVIVDPYSNKPYIHYYATRRVGGAVTNFEAYKLLRTAAN